MAVVNLGPRGIKYISRSWFTIMSFDSRRCLSPNVIVRHSSTSSIRLSIEIMKFTIVSILITYAASTVSAIDFGVLGERAILNLNLTPACAQTCILNPKWARTYAPECAGIPLGIEYATKLCQSYLYQHMLDSCFKDKCNDNDRKRVFMHPRIHVNCRRGNWGKRLAKVTEFMLICLPGKIVFNILFSLRSNASKRFFPYSFALYRISCALKSPSAILRLLYSQFVWRIALSRKPWHRAYV